VSDVDLTGFRQSSPKRGRDSPKNQEKEASQADRRYAHSKFESPLEVSVPPPTSSSNPSWFSNFAVVREIWIWGYDDSVSKAISPSPLQAPRLSVLKLLVVTLPAGASTS
jgi:hypothetical protein